MSGCGPPARFLQAARGRGQGGAADDCRRRIRRRRAFHSAASTETAVDSASVLRFRLGAFPVSVYPSFLIAAALLGYVWMDAWQTLLIWIGVVFVSVLVHELGHAVVALAFGGRPEIRLEGFGGVTFPRSPWTEGTCCRPSSSA